MRGVPGYAALLDRVAKATPAVLRSRPAFSVSDPNLIAEGLAYDPVGRWFNLGGGIDRETDELAELAPPAHWLTA